MALQSLGTAPGTAGNRTTSLHGNRVPSIGGNRSQAALIREVEVTKENDRLTIDTGPSSRLVVSRWDTSRGHALVAVAPEYFDRHGEWRLAHSAVSIPPEAAGAVADAIRNIGAQINAQPPEPAPTQQDRDDSRWP